MKNTLILLATISFFYSCNSKKTETGTDGETEKVVSQTAQEQEEYVSFKSNLSEQEQDTLLTDLASFIIRKPAAALWDTKFNPEFRKYYVNNRSELELVYLTEAADTFYYYLLREARTNEGIKKRGTGGKYIVNNTTKSIEEFEEVFVSKVLPESELKKIGLEYMDLATGNSDLTEFLSDNERIEWPDGRLFYSKQKKEWRYVE